jgi:hypothetical protein
MRKAMVLGLMGLAGAIATPAMAADEFSGLRLGVNLSSEKFNADYYDSFDNDPTVAIDPLTSDRFGFGAFGGWGFNKYLAVEVGYNGGGEFNAHVFGPDPAGEFFDKSRTSLSGVEATVVGSLWLGKKFSIFGRAGMFGWKAEAIEHFGFYDDPTLDVRLKTNDSGFDPVFGVGIQTVLDEALVRLEYKYTEIGDLFWEDDNGTPGNTADDIQFSWRDQNVSSVTLSLVWIIH